MLITDGLFRNARARPDAVALRRGARALTYSETARQVAGIARGVAERAGAGDSKRVGILLEDPVDFMLAMLGIVASGHIAVPFSTDWAPAELEAAIELAAPSLILTDRGGHAGGVRLEDLTRNASAAGRTPAPDEPFYVGFTSGSSGRPKGAIRSHRAWTESFHLMTLEFGVRPGDAVVVPGSLFFSFALNAAMHAAFTGATVIFPAEAGTRGLLQALEHGATLYALPSVLADLARLTKGRRDQAPALRRIITAGERLDPVVAAAVRETFPATELFQYYGASELGYVTILRPEDFDSHAASIGRAALGVEIAILDEQGRNVPVGDVGVLCVWTPFGFSGYIGDPRGPSAIDHFDWRTVGDLARIDVDGYVYLSGRRDNMVVLRGQNVYPEVVEEVLRSVPGVRQALAVPEPAARPRHLVAVVELSNEVPSTAILDHAKAALSGPRVPRRVVIVEALPRNAAGKVDRRAAAALIG